MPDPQIVELLEDATRRLVRTVDELSDEDLSAPSLLPGWSRAHVVAHLALNAEGLAGATLVGEEIAELPDNLASTRIDRTPGGRTFAAAAVPGMRLREVEIHHVDLASEYSRSDWPLEFAKSLVDQLVDRADASGPFTAYAVDADRTFQRGEGGPRIVGTSSDLGWWLTGRGNGEGLTSEGGDLPRIGAW